LLSDPFAGAGLPSPGGGADGTGMGGEGRNGKGQGIDGTGLGGTGHGTGSLVPPVLIYKTEPEFSDEARRAKLQGTILIDAEVGADGIPRNIRVRESLGLGLDECAIAAVEKWRFRPALRNGKPVPVPVTITVNFHLL
ncbi:MAG: energy transducer TonB, partial [Bryobacteraceae bacterium]